MNIRNHFPTEELQKRDAAHHLHPFSAQDDLAKKGSKIITSAQGVYVFDSNGKRYLEGLAGLWCTSLGYGNEEIIQVAQEQMRKFTFCHLFGGKSHPSAIELSEKLASIAPIDDARVFLGTSGSDANDTQIKNLRYYFNAIGKPEKRKIISRK